jgi:hypothetical protein
MDIKSLLQIKTQNALEKLMIKRASSNDVLTDGWINKNLKQAEFAECS